ncbi:signal transducer and activator of transcription 5A-like isoform X1 [Bolinopsis microptera]|uniref:signal transducer and activator of transcription 5A-like isoform X1 n=1 Tax=Bolinopsis microptera TaxID=2820187 RepID=UPI00307AD052
MAQWGALVTQPNRALQLYRDKDFPLDVRHHLAHYIESRSWMSLPPTRAQEELAGLINALDAKVVELQNTGQLDLVLASHKLSQCRAQLINLYGKNPVLLLQTLSMLLQTEHKLLTEEFQQQCMSPMSGPMTPLSAPMTPDMNQSRSGGLPAISNTLTNLDSWGQSANIICQYLGNTKDVLNKMSPNKRVAMQSKMKRLQGNLDKHLQTIEQARRYLRSSIETTVAKLCVQNEMILQNITDYKLSQRRALVRFEAQVNINDVEARVKSHVVELETCLQQIRLAVRHYNTVKDISSNSPDESMTIISLRDKVVNLIKNLVSNALVIEELPSAILKKDTKFAATLRLLVGGHFGIKMNLPEVTCTLVSFSQIQDILSGEVLPNKTGCGDILNGSNVMEHHPSTNSVKLFMKKLMLKKYTRASSADKAGEERYGLCFTSTLSLHLAEEQSITLCTISPSLALIVHTRQIALAEATVIWDNSFCQNGEKPIEEVTWAQLGKVLSSWFKMQTGRGLSDNNVRCLGRKLLRSDHVSDKDTVSWKVFAKENQADRAFSFWDWVYSAYDLIDKCLRDLWKDGLVEGFISKDEVQSLLYKCEPNTFILRFSDSMVGGISASWLHQEPGGRSPGEILHLEPSTHRGLSYISLAERIMGLPDLKVLYPNKPKNQVFSKYIQKREMGASDTAYVRQNISVSVDLPRHHSAPLLSNDSSFGSTLNSPCTPYLDDDLFDSLDCSDFNVSPTAAHEMPDDQYPNPHSDSTIYTHPDSMLTESSMYSVGDIEPSLAELDLDSLINTAQNNLNSISNINNGNSSTDHDMFFGDHW